MGNNKSLMQYIHQVHKSVIQLLRATVHSGTRIFNQSRYNYITILRCLEYRLSTIIPSFLRASATLDVRLSVRLSIHVTFTTIVPGATPYVGVKCKGVGKSSNIRPISRYSS